MSVYTLIVFIALYLRWSPKVSHLFNPFDVGWCIFYFLYFSSFPFFFLYLRHLFIHTILLLFSYAATFTTTITTITTFTTTTTTPFYSLPYYFSCTLCHGCYYFSLFVLYLGSLLIYTILLPFFS